MSFIEETLIKDEKVVKTYQIHQFYFIISLLFFWTIIGIYYYVKMKYTEYALTNKRVITKTGIIGRSTEEMNLDKVETVEIHQGILGRIFGYGDIYITGTGSSFVIVGGVPNPIEVKKSIDAQLYT